MLSKALAIATPVCYCFWNNSLRLSLENASFEFKSELFSVEKKTFWAHSGEKSWIKRTESEIWKQRDRQSHGRPNHRWNARHTGLTMGILSARLSDCQFQFSEILILKCHQGIRFRGHTFVEATEKLPKAPNGEEPLPEAFIWFLLTGEFPTEEQFRDISAEILANSEVPADIEAFIKKLPKDMHPMTQLSLAILRLQPTSKFAKAYAQGIHKAKYWEPVYDDFISLIAKLPRLAALIYRNTFKVK